jgi:hypothetical protein
MTRIGVISNPLSQQNRRRLDRVRAALADGGKAVDHVELDAIEEVPGIVSAFVRGGVDVLAINGGDGTVQAVITALINGTQAADRPPVAVIPAGMTNLIATDVGLRGEPEKVLAKLLSRAAKGKLEACQRALMTLSAAPEEPGIHGMFAGAGAFHDTVVWSRRKIHTLGAERDTAVGLALLALGLRSLLGLTRGSPLATCTPMSIAFDDADSEQREIFVLLATTLQRMMMGIMPFWNGGEAELKVTTIDYPPRRLTRALLPVLRGKPRPWMERAGYHSRRARHVSIASAKPIVFDGEFFDAEKLGRPAGTPLRLQHRHDLRFIR